MNYAPVMTPHRGRDRSVLVPFVPQRTTLPAIESRTSDVLVLVDDENIRLAALLELHRVPSYLTLARVCASKFKRAEVHVFTVRDETEIPTYPARTARACYAAPGIAARPRFTVHRKTTSGKNVDMDIAVWFLERLHTKTPAPTHVIFCTGDIDYLVLYEEARRRDIEAGFLAAPGRSFAKDLREKPHGFLGRDVLQRGGAPGQARPERRRDFQL